MKYAIVYVMFWWVIFYMSLPFGVKKIADAPEKGHASSAPKNPHLKLKMLITTLLAAAATYGWYLYSTMGEGA